MCSSRIPTARCIVGPVWPGDSVFPDFTLTRVRDWWGRSVQGFRRTWACRGFWNDMNEPSVFQRADKTMPLDTRPPARRRHDSRSSRGSQHVRHGECRAPPTKGCARLQAERAAVCADARRVRRHAALCRHLDGRQQRTWNHLWMSTPMLLNLGFSGLSACRRRHRRICRASPPAGLADALVWSWARSIRSIAITPSKGTAITSRGCTVRSTKRFAAATSSLRYKLLPYIYTGMEDATRTGVPFMRPVFLDYPQADGFYRDDRDFLFGARPFCGARRD